MKLTETVVWLTSSVTNGHTDYGETGKFHEKDKTFGHVL